MNAPNKRVYDSSNYGGGKKVQPFEVSTAPQSGVASGRFNNIQNFADRQEVQHSKSQSNLGLVVKREDSLRNE